ncbi:CHAT domain-containing protein [Streptomyces jeddahensis]|uniref:CHAT domain protein n=1 Tax=Streptomyces jeddahensis TaxID=1716141 RepID=A0A177HHT6_9ACTN|nr:CHAT domain-containing protein [Streptomyces jeddahensis]OAH10160.1 CHAT domain protein [Streptomyces jeddahensis]
MPEGLTPGSPGANPVLRRISTYSTSRDPHVLLEIEAEQEAAGCLEAAVRGVLRNMQLDVQPHLRLLEQVGWLFWLRTAADSQHNPRHDRDLRLMLTLFAPLRDAEPESVPGTVRRVIPPAPQPGAPQVRGWGDFAGFLLQEAGPHDRTAQLAAAAVLQLGMVMAEIDAERARATSNLVHVLTLLHEHHAVPDTMTAAVSLARRLFSESSDGTPEQAQYLARLCDALRVAYETRHTPDALAELIGLTRKALESLPGNHPDRPDHITNLAGLLHLRYQETSDTESLREAVALSRSLIAALPPGHPAVSRELNNLAFHLETLSELDGGLTDTAALNEIIDLGRTALAPTRGPEPPLELRIALTANLSRWLRLRAQLTPSEDKAAGDTDEALRLARQAYDSSAGHPTGVVLEALATALSDLYARSGDREALDEAVTILRKAVNTADTPFRQAMRRFMLGARLNNRYLDLGDPADAREAAQMLREVAGSSAASVRHRLEGAWNAGKLALALDAPATAAEDLTLAVRLLPELIAQQWQDADRARRLSAFAPLPTVSAACLISTGRPERALELLEQGRGLIHGESAAIAVDLERLRAQSPDLATALENLPGEWQAAPDADRRHQLAEKRQRLISEIRRVPGFEEFLQPPRLEEILAACKAGPVVVPIAGPDGDRSHALIVTENGVRCLPLPRLTKDTVRALGTSILTGSELALDTDRSPSERVLAEHELRSGLALLWDAVVGPVLNAVRDLPRSGADDPAGPPRLWWCPTGFLAYFPLHMAEHPEEGSAFDLVTSSYTPTVHALGRSRPWRASAGNRPLVVAVPHAPGVPDLPGADEEAAVLVGMLPGTRLLRGQAATRKRLMAELQNHDIIHIASHAGYDADRQYEGHLVLHDGRLHVSDIATARAGQGGLAFLSACGTARSRLDVPDESLNLLSAFQLAGYSHLVGSLWPVTDQASVRLAEAFYQYLTTHQSTGAAHALHHAVSQLRARHPDRPSLWASHVHIGP